MLKLKQDYNGLSSGLAITIAKSPQVAALRRSLDHAR